MKLEPGETSINPRSVRYDQSIEAYVLDWSVRLYDGKRLRKRSQGKRKAQVVPRARKSAEALLKQATGVWKPSHDLGKYILDEAIPSIDNDPDLRPTSKQRYTGLLRLAAGECAQHTHKRALTGYTVADGTRLAVLEQCIQEVSTLHGAGSARQLKNALSKYVLTPLTRHSVIGRNTLKGESIKLDRSLTNTRTSRGGVAISPSDYKRLLDHLLSLNNAEGLNLSKRTQLSAYRRAENARLTTLIQMSTGMRIGEVRALTWGDVVKEDCFVRLPVGVETSKTHKSRSTAVLWSSVADLLLERAATSNPAYPIIPTPTKLDVAWDKDNHQKTIAKYYKIWADELGIPELRTERSHVWRTTVNSMLAGAIPDAIRAALLGHTEQVNANAYTDITHQLPTIAGVLEAQFSQPASD